MSAEWSCLISFARALLTCKEGKQAKNSKWKYTSPPSIEPATFWFLAGYLDRLAIETLDYLCFKLLQYSEVTGNAWGVSKHVKIQLIKVLKLKGDDFEWYPWTLENWRHCLGLKRLNILYNIIIISFGMRFSTFELHSVVVHVFVLVLFLKRYTRRAKMTSTLSLCSLLYITEALSKENLCSVS